MKKKTKKTSIARKTESFNFDGVITALVTPFKKGRVDFSSLKKIVRSQMDCGIQGFVVNGTTSESPTLTTQEVEQIFRLVKKETYEAVPIILGTGTNSTQTTIQNTKLAERLGAHAALIVAPYYNKPPQRGLFLHYSSVAKSVRLPIILYNVPSRTVISLSSETVSKLSKIKNIVGIKETSGKTDFFIEEESIKQNKFILLSGEDSTCIDFMLAGGAGVISVISHIIPKELRVISDMALRKIQQARQEYAKYTHLNQLLGIEINPIPVKSMLHLIGMIESPELRLPLVTVTKENKKMIKDELTLLGLI
ncbi:MAG: 4-hydroxy-tetrahydrodipicolinate synthase [Bdellovibrionales bacterium RBG_16_40_8]|nr:MAG: 4-hydroxy-tetrahydrodipicolinate synthase [Bdellovibrionales bacterium RBG_16_40_8]